MVGVTDRMVPPVRPAALNATVGVAAEVAPTLTFWKVMDTVVAVPFTTGLYTPAIAAGKALSAAWILPSRVPTVALQAIGPVTAPLTVSVNVPPVMPGPKVMVWTAFIVVA